MSVIVRPADLNADGDAIIRLLSTHLNVAYDRTRFEWLYCRNPDGEGRAWVAEEAATGEIVGTSAAIPRRFYVSNVEALAWVLSDFCVADNYRTLGIALKLQRACLAEVDRGTVPFCYDFPSPRMMAVYRRLRIEPTHHMVRLVRPLRVNRNIRKHVASLAIANALSAAGNLFLALRSPRERMAGDPIISFHKSFCGEEFSALAREINGRYGVCVRRSAEYLNWRYGAVPYQRCEFLTARCGGTLVGYAVFADGGDDAALIDLFGVEQPAIIRALIDSVVALLWRRGALAISAQVLTSHRWRPLLRERGFISRETLPVIVYFPRHRHSDQILSDRLPLYLLQGDRDT